MSSNLEPILDTIQSSNYITLASIALVVYDYALTFPREIDYVWRKPWSWISLTFLIVRYVGLSWAIIYALSGSTFIPGPQEVNVSHGLSSSTGTTVTSVYREGSITNSASEWEYIIFLTAADLMMVLRVYAMWNRSNAVLYALLLICVIQLVVSIALGQLYYNPNNLSVTVVQVLNFSFCNLSFTYIPSLYTVYVNLPRWILAGALLVLAILPTLKQSVRMYKATKQWQPNQYVRLFVKDGIFYFLLNILISVRSVIYGNTSNSFLVVFLEAFGSAGVCIMMPRFIIGVREMYDRDIRGRWDGIDTGFGVSSQRGAGHDDTFSEMDFADVGPNFEGQSVGGLNADEYADIPLAVQNEGSPLGHDTMDRDAVDAGMIQLETGLGNSTNHV